MSTLSISRPELASETVRPIGLGSAGIHMTAAQFDALEDCDENYRYELIDGVLVVTPIPSEAEGDPNEELGHRLRTYAETHPQGSTLDATLPERYIHTRNRRRADRVIWAGLGRRPNPRLDPPTIVVEFVSPGRRSFMRDYVEKRDEYLAAGVREYWVIDRFRRTLTVYQQPPAPADGLVIAETGVYRPELLPGFELPLAPLLALADRWADVQ
jgi:Uma2 family endonuclease